MLLAALDESALLQVPSLVTDSDRLRIFKLLSPYKTSSDASSASSRSACCFYPEEPL